MKFGGTSVGSAKSIRGVLSIVKSKLEKNPIVVVSAVGGITDKLLQKARDAEHGNTNISEIEQKHIEIIRELKIDESVLSKEFGELEAALQKISSSGLSKKLLDLVASFGERMASKIVAEYFNANGVKARALFAYDIGFRSDSNFTDAELDPITYENLKNEPLLKEKGVVNVVTGFIAKDRKGDITTLGRGGSDFTAAILGNGIDAEIIEIWTDVNGILTADPRIVSAAMPIDEISFSEAAELAYYGAKVLHPKTILPAVEKNIPVAVLNTHNPSHKGTTIRKADVGGKVFKAISAKKNVSVIRIVSSRMLGAYGFLAKIFDIFNSKRIAVDVVATSEVSISLTVDSKTDLSKALEELKEFGKISVTPDMAIICVVGRGMRNLSGAAGNIFSTIGAQKINIEMISQGASQVNVTFVVKNSDADKAVIALHKELIESDIGKRGR